MTRSKKLLIVWFIFSLLFLIIENKIHAGIWNTTAHSRANCMGFNESCTWNAHSSNWWEVKSVHWYRSIGAHEVLDPMRYTWRSIGYHVGEWEGPQADNWFVEGFHFYLDGVGRKVYDVYTSATDCSQYDGWW